MTPSQRARELALHAAAQRGDLNDVAMLLLDGVNINCAPNGGSTALHKATYCNKLDVVGFLLTNGADMEARDEDGNTPLILAVFFNHVSIVRLLLEKRANIDVHDFVQPDDAACDRRFGQTPFLFAEKKGHDQVTQLLVEYSSKRVYEAELLQALREKQYPDAATLLHQDIIDANLCDHDKMPLLHLIVATQNMWLLRTMLAKPQLDVNARDKGGRTALTFAIALFNVEVALALYQAGTRIDTASTKLLASTSLFGNALLRAASVDDASVVIQLLGLGVLPAFANETGETALHLAAAKGHTTTVTMLLEHLQAGDDLNATNHAGASPLFVAIAGGHAHVVGQLVAANARKDCVTNDGSTLLHAAVRSRNMNLLDLALSFASDLNACDSLGQTPLHIAVLLHHKEAVTCLVRADANVFATTKRGMTPYMSASDPGIRAILKDAETVFDEQLARHLEAAERRNPPPRRHSDASAPTLYQTTRSLPTPTDRRKQPASNVGLVEAVRQQEYDKVLQLLADGGNPNAATEAGDSLLHLAVIGGDHKIVSVLSQTRGVRLHVRNADGWTPVVLAVQLGRRRLASLLHTAARTLTPVVCTVAHAKDLDRATTLPSHDVVVDFASLLGGGAHGNVYKGTYKGRTVAVKFAKQTTDATGLEKEIETMQLCPSPYVLSLLAYTKSPNPKLILEYMDAGNLHEYLVRKRLGETTAVHVTPLQVAWVVANALADLHHDGLLHRDIKSPNVLLCSTNFIKLADLGIAREFESNMTMGIGTLRWMAPELLNPQQTYNSAADMYAFGALLTELDTLELPFASETEPDKIRRKLSKGSLRPHFTPTYAPWLHDLATACLSFDPTARPTAQEVVHRLQRQMDQARNHKAADSVATGNSIVPPVSRTRVRASTLQSARAPPLGRLQSEIVGVDMSSRQWAQMPIMSTPPRRASVGAVPHNMPQLPLPVPFREPVLPLPTAPNEPSVFGQTNTYSGWSTEMLVATTLVCQTCNETNSLRDVVCCAHCDAPLPPAPRKLAVLLRRLNVAAQRGLVIDVTIACESCSRTGQPMTRAGCGACGEVFPDDVEKVCILLKRIELANRQAQP